MSDFYSEGNGFESDRRNGYAARGPVPRKLPTSAPKTTQFEFIDNPLSYRSLAGWGEG